MSVLCSSDTPGGRLLGVPVPLSLDPGEKTDPGTAVAVGVTVPELGLDVDMLVVDSNNFDRLGFDRRNGRDAREEAGDPRCLGSIIDDPRSAGYLGGFCVASCGGVMRGLGDAPVGMWMGANLVGPSAYRLGILASSFGYSSKVGERAQLFVGLPGCQRCVTLLAGRGHRAF